MLSLFEFGLGDLACRGGLFGGVDLWFDDDELGHFDELRYFWLHTAWSMVFLPAWLFGR